MSSPSVSPRPCAASLSAYSLRVPGCCADLLVHQRLGQSRGVLLVVAQLAEADDVHHHVFLELHAELQRELGGQHHGLGIVAVHVQHRRLDHLDHVGAVQRGTRVARVRLVVKPIWLLMTRCTVPPV